jgi:hypothetical protein
MPVRYLALTPVGPARWFPHGERQKSYLRGRGGRTLAVRRVQQLMSDDG